MTKNENIDSVSIDIAHKAREDIAQSVFAEAYNPSGVLERRYRFDVFADIDSYGVKP